MTATDAKMTPATHEDRNVTTDNQAVDSAVAVLAAAQPRSEDARALLRECRDAIDAFNDNLSSIEVHDLLARIDAAIAAGEGGKT